MGDVIPKGRFLKLSTVSLMSSVYFNVLDSTSKRCLVHAVAVSLLVRFRTPLRKHNCTFREWLPGVQAKIYGGAPFGVKILSAVWNPEAFASRRVRYMRFHCIETMPLIYKDASD